MNFTPMTPPTTQLFKKIDMGKVEEMITPDRSGRVRFQGSFWRARLLNSTGKHDRLQILPGEWVKVVGRIGLTLLVQHDANRWTHAAFDASAVEG